MPTVGNSLCWNALSNSLYTIYQFVSKMTDAEVKEFDLEVVDDLQELEVQKEFGSRNPQIVKDVCFDRLERTV